MRIDADNHEFVAAHAGRHVLGAQHGTDGPGRRLQHQVAGLVAKGVIGLLETVEIHLNHCKALALAALVKLPAEPVEEATVGKPGQIIVIRRKFDPCLAFLQGGGALFRKPSLLGQRLRQFHIGRHIPFRPDKAGQAA